MRRFRELLLSGAVLALAGPALAGPPDITGVWCAADGNGVLFIEPDAIGLGEHTVCRVEETLAGRADYAGRLSCKSYYYDGDRMVEAFSREIALEIRLLEDGRLSLLTDRENEKEPTLWKRCK